MRLIRRKDLLIHANTQICSEHFEKAAGRYLRRRRKPPKERPFTHTTSNVDYPEETIAAIHEPTTCTRTCEASTQTESISKDNEGLKKDLEYYLVKKKGLILREMIVKSLSMVMAAILESKIVLSQRRLPSNMVAITIEKVNNARPLFPLYCT